MTFPLCVGIEAGALSGRSRSIEAPVRQASPWAAARAGAAVLVMPWRRVGFALDADLVVPFTRTRVEIDARGEVHRVGPVSGGITVGIEVRPTR